MVRQIERLCPEFDRMGFTNPKFSGEAHVDSDTSWTNNIGPAHIAERACVWLREGCGVHPRLVVFCSIRIGKHLIRTLRPEAVQRVIQTGCYRQVTAG